MSDVSIPGEAAKAAIPASYVVGAEFMGLTPDNWITALTLVYLIIQLILIMPRLSKQLGPWFVRRYIAATLLIQSMRKDKENE